MTTKPENQQIQQGPPLHPEGFKEQRHVPWVAPLRGAEKEIGKREPDYRIEHVKAAAAGTLSALAVLMVSANPCEKEWAEKEIRRLIALGMED